MTKQSASELAKELFNKVQTIKLYDAAAIFGTTSQESLLQGLRKHVAGLSTTLIAKKQYKEIMLAHEAVAADIDTAGLTGLISEAELPDYYLLLDKLWKAIESEN